MTSEEIARIMDRLVDKVKLLETELELQENRIYELEHDYHYLDSRLEDLESSINWTPPNG